jgi:hypothetical protein
VEAKEKFYYTPLDVRLQTAFFDLISLGKLFYTDIIMKNLNYNSSSNSKSKKE